MPPTPEQAEPSRPAPTQAGRLAFWAAVAATTGVLAAVALAALQIGDAAPSAAHAWLLALGAAGCAAGVAWTLWRQRELEAALREARTEVRALTELCDT